jgi:hypothetical protein
MLILLRPFSCFFEQDTSSCSHTNWSRGRHPAPKAQLSSLQSQPLLHFSNFKQPILQTHCSVVIYILQLSGYLRSKTWDTRVAAGQAIAALCATTRTLGSAESVQPTSSSSTDLTSATRMLHNHTRIHKLFSRFSHIHFS